MIRMFSLTVNKYIFLPVLLLTLMPVASGAADSTRVALSLDSCLHLARTNNRELRSASLAVDRAEQVKAQALTKYFPQISGTALGYYSLHPLLEVGIDDLANDHARNLLNSLYSQFGEALGLHNSWGFMQYGYAAGVTALQPVYVGGKIVNGNRLAEVGVEAAELQRQIHERDLLETVEESYWLVVGLRDKQTTLTSTLSLLDTLHRVVESAVDAGLALPSDLLQVEMRCSEMARTQVQLRNGLSLATRALCQSIGLPYSDTLVLVLDTVPTLSSMLPSDSLSMQAASGSSPESSLLSLQTRAAELQYRMTLADALPQVAVGAAYGYGKLQADIVRNDLGHSTGNGALMVSVSVPLTAWWETGHRLKEQSLAIEQARLDEANKNELLDLRLQQAADQLMEAVWLVSETEKALSKAQENYRLTSLNYRAGLGTITELLTAQSLLYKAQNDLTDAHITYRLRLRRYCDPMN